MWPPPAGLLLQALSENLPKCADFIVLWVSSPAFWEPLLPSLIFPGSFSLVNAIPINACILLDPFSFDYTFS